MNIDRMNRLDNLLTQDAANPQGVQFDLGSWSKPSDTVTAWEAYPIEDPKITVDCGTKACALGLAAISGEFAAEGLTFQIYPQTSDRGILIPTFDNKVDFEAGAAFFELTDAESHFLFDPYKYTTIRGAKAELEVVNRIKYLVGGGQVEDYRKT